MLRRGGARRVREDWAYEMVGVPAGGRRLRAAPGLVEFRSRRAIVVWVFADRVGVPRVLCGRVLGADVVAREVRVAQAPGAVRGAPAAPGGRYGALMLERRG